MFEGINDPLKDSEGYLKRINYVHKECSVDELDGLILAHQMNVPFEDLDPYFGKDVSLATEDLYEKIVVKRRGGYCFELNGAFAELLKALGYKVYSGMCRIIYGRGLPMRDVAMLHRVNYVEFEDGLYVCDVGYGGPMPSFALKLEDGYTKTKNGSIFYIRKLDGSWWMIGRVNSAGEKEDIMAIDDTEAFNVDFCVQSYFTATNEGSYFRKALLANRRTENGSVSITNDEFTIHENGNVQKIQIKDRAHLAEILKTYFGIEYDLGE